MITQILKLQKANPVQQMRLKNYNCSSFTKEKDPILHVWVQQNYVNLKDYQFIWRLN